MFRKTDPISRPDSGPKICPAFLGYICFDICGRNLATISRPESGREFGPRKWTKDKKNAGLKSRPFSVPEIKAVFRTHVGQFSDVTSSGERVRSRAFFAEFSIHTTSKFRRRV